MIGDEVEKVVGLDTSGEVTMPRGRLSAAEQA
jgi:hypothetical protein